MRVLGDLLTRRRAASTTEFLRDVYRSDRKRLLLVLLATVVGVVLEGVIVGLVFPVLDAAGAAEPNSENVVGATFDRAFDELGLRPTVLTLFFVALGLSGARWVALLAQGALAADLRTAYVMHKRLALFDALLAARWSFFWDHRSGALTNKVLVDAERIGAVYLNVQTIVVNLLTLTVYTAVAVASSWAVSVTTILIGVALLAATRPVSRRTSATGKEITSRSGEMLSLIEEVFDAVKTVKATAMEPAARARLEPVVRRFAAISARNTRLTVWLTSSFEVASVVALLLILLVGTQVLDVAPTTVLVIAAIFGRLFPRLTAIQHARQALFTYTPSMRAVMDMLEAATAAREERGTAPEVDLPLPIGVELEHLVVTLRGRRVIDDVSFEVAPGGHVGIVGPSGSGKSTLANCIVRLIPWDSGSIRVGGVDVADLPLASWRSRVGYVTQETILFHGTMRDNISWGREAITTDDDVVRAAVLAGLDEVIALLPGGLDTVVGDRGQLLSGGERQRVGLARALLGMPLLLILDEATSALDAAGEHTILEAIHALPPTITKISIAHRLAAVRQADEIVVLDEGRLVERGSWDDLLARDSHFAALWRLQSS